MKTVILLITTIFCLHTRSMAMSESGTGVLVKQINVFAPPITLGGTLFHGNDVDFEELKHKYRHKKKGKIVIRNKGNFIEIELQSKSLLGWRKKVSYFCNATNYQKIQHYIQLVMKHKDHKIMDDIIDLTKEQVTKICKIRRSKKHQK